VALDVLIGYAGRWEDEAVGVRPSIVGVGMGRVESMERADMF
jgi:hypothetical protein